jgi:hypothetical protein
MPDVWLCVVERDEWPPRITTHDTKGDAYAQLRETIISDLTEGNYQRERLDRLDDFELRRLYADETDLHSYVERAVVPSRSTG